MRSSKNEQIGEAERFLNASDSHARETHFMVSDNKKTGGIQWRKRDRHWSEKLINMS